MISPYRSGSICGLKKCRSSQIVKILRRAKKKTFFSPRRAVCSIKRRTRDRARFDARKRRSRSLQYLTSAESRLDSLDSDVRVHAGGPFTLQLPVLFSELRRRRQAGRNMSRLVRALLGLPKPKGSDEREPDDDDPPYPDVTVVVIINKRSGSRLVRGRTASRPFDSRCFSTSDLHFELYSARPRRVIRS